MLQKYCFELSIFTEIKTIKLSAEWYVQYSKIIFQSVFVSNIII